MGGGEFTNHDTGFELSYERKGKVEATSPVQYLHNDRLHGKYLHPTNRSVPAGHLEILL